MRSQAGGDEIDLAVVQLTADLLREQQRIDDGIEAAQRGHGLFCLQLGIVSSCRYIFVLSDFCRKGGECTAADIDVFFVLVIILKQGVAERIFFSVYGERIKFHIGKLCHVVDLVRSREGLGQSGNGTLGFRIQAVCLVAENLGEIAAVRI